MPVGSTSQRSVQELGFTKICLLTPLRRLYPLPVRQASVLPAASSRFHLAMDTVAVQLTLPLAGCVEDFHLQVSAPCRAQIPAPQTPEIDRWAEEWSCPESATMEAGSTEPARPASIAEVLCPVTKKVAAPADPATSMVRSVRSACYPSKSLQTPRRQETKEFESVFSQVLQKPVRLLGAGCCKRSAMNRDEDCIRGLCVVSARVSFAAQEHSRPLWANFPCPLHGTP